MLDHYRVHGYAVVRDVISEPQFDLAWRVIEPWVERIIEGWRSEGLIDRSFGDRSRWDRLRDAWNAAGRPHFRRQPFKNLMVPEMFALMRSPALCNVAAHIIGTSELSIHGIFNARAQLPSSDPLHLSPFHQDAQYWNQDFDGREPDIEGKTHVMTMWIPLRDVDERSGCLQFMSTQDTGGVLFEPHGYDVERTGLVGLSPETVERYSAKAVPMKLGDVLVFTQRTPHAAIPVSGSPLRWSVDMRYEATVGRTHIGKKFGFIVQSAEDPASETTLEEWLRRRQR